MGVAREQKLVIKHTFLEYVCDQPEQEVPVNRRPARQRSWTEPKLEGLDPIYEEVRDLFHGSDSSGSDIDENVQVEPSCGNKRMLMPSTPEASPLRGPAVHHAPLPKYESSMPAAALGVTGYGAWPDQMDSGSWWVSMPCEMNMGAYCHNADPAGIKMGMNQFQPQYPEVDTRSGFGPLASVTNLNFMRSDAEKVLSSNTDSQAYAKVVNTDAESAARETRTSVMLKGVPDTCTRSLMLQLLDAAGFFGRFNFLYLPMDFKRNKNLGYALINMVSPKEALRLGKHFEGFTAWNGLGGSGCTVTWCSPQQGLQAHIERYKNSPVMHESVPEEWRPLLLMHGVPVSFPPPTLKIKAPKLKGIQ